MFRSVALGRQLKNTSHVILIDVRGSGCVGGIG